MNIFVDCRCGVSGRTFLAALCHLGLDWAPLERILREAGLPCPAAVRPAIGPLGPGVCLEQCSDGNGAVPEGRGGEAPLRDALLRVDVAETVRGRAMATLDTLLHALAVAGNAADKEDFFAAAGERVAEVLGVCWGLEALGVRRVVASALPWDTGIMPGTGSRPLPLPRPAVAHLLLGKPVLADGAACPGERVTLEGAALLYILAQDFQPGPQGRLLRVGTGYAVGAGNTENTETRLPGGHGLRLCLLEEAFAAAGADSPHREMVCLLETHVDHLSGEELGVALQELSALPKVLDVLWLPGIGKKNRPAGALRVLCLPIHAEAVERDFFAHTHSLGIRCQHMERTILPRGACTVDTAAGPLRAKRYAVDGRGYVRVECDALRTAAEELGVTPLALARGELRRG